MTSIICYNSKIFINERKDECKDRALWAACEGGERSAGSSAEHDVVHDLREVPPSVRHPDLVRVARQYWPGVNIKFVLITPQVKSSWQNAKECNTSVSPWQFYCDPYSSNIYIEPFMSPLKKKWWRGWLRSRSHMESGLRGRLNWHHTKLLVLSISEEVSSIWSLQANIVWKPWYNCSHTCGHKPH